jgi:hypothetical protein
MVMFRESNWDGGSLVSPPPGGWPRYGFSRQLPESISEPRISSESTHLPGALALDGWQLLRVEEDARYHSADPFVLYNPWGEIVAQWEMRPSLGTLMEYVP